MSKNNILERTVKSIPLMWYFDSNHYEKELSKIWSDEWIYVCHENNLKESLNYITLTVSKINVLILRDNSNSLKAYLNTCRHRGSLICKKRNGKLKNNIWCITFSIVIK